jgi:hypothetical protein
VWSVHTVTVTTKKQQQQIEHPEYDLKGTESIGKKKNGRRR